MSPSPRLNGIRAAVLGSAVAAATAISVIASPGMALAANAAKASAAGCQVSAPAAPSWLGIEGHGFAPGTLYMVKMVNPNGVVTGNSQYSNPDGTLSDASLQAVISGAYQVSISKLNGGPTLASCSTTVA